MKVDKINTIHSSHPLDNHRNAQQNLPDADPFVLSHFEAIANLKANPYTDSVAQQNIQNQRIPPTFDEIRQQMCESNLHSVRYLFYRS